MANHAVARGKLTVERVIFPGPSQGNKMGEKLEGNAHWQLRARQFQRFYHATPRQKNRDLITAEHLARAKLLQPDYKLPAAAEGDDGDGEKEEAWPVTWNNPNSLRGTLNHRTWKAYPTKEAIGSTKVRKAAPEPAQEPAPKSAPEPAQNPPSGSVSVPHELEIISEVPLDHLQHQPATGIRPTPTPTTVPPDNRHVPDPPQQATAQLTPNGSLSLDPAYPSLPGNLVPAAPQTGIPLAELDSRFQDVKRSLSRLVVNAKKPRHDAEPIGNEGISGSGALSRGTQGFRDDAEPVGNEGSSGWGDFLQGTQRFHDDTGPIGNDGYTNWSPNLHRPYLQETQRFQDGAEPIGNEGFESAAFPQVTQTSHNHAEPVGNEGSEGAFSQDDFRMFLAWRRERRARAGNDTWP